MAGALSFLAFHKGGKLFGERRSQNVGPVSVLRVSGWDQDQYLIKSVTDERVLIEERYYLSDNGLKLFREVSIQGREVAPKNLLLAFDRVP